MNIVIDTSIVLSVITNEKHKDELIKITKGSNLIVPSSLPWEIGNAFTAMFKRKRITLKKAMAALHFYRQIPLRFVDVPLSDAIEIIEEELEEEENEGMDDDDDDEEENEAVEE